jgi:hypothetical protein
MNKIVWQRIWRCSIVAIIMAIISYGVVKGPCQAVEMMSVWFLGILALIGYVAIIFAIYLLIKKIYLWAWAK